MLPELTARTSVSVPLLREPSGNDILARTVTPVLGQDRASLSTGSQLAKGT